MVAGSQQQLHQQPPPSSSLPSAEEEAIKRNTDCVYFLASPLTCKKGSECEYRHSEYARVNPRDCWYWLNGSCLNPKCSFRHPPLDGLLGTQVAASAGSSLPSPQTAVMLATHTHNSSKQAVPCIFFQKGLCLKGDRCAFLHGPNPTINKAPLVLATAPSTEPPSLKKAYGGLEKCKEQKIQQPSVVEMPPVAKSDSKGDTAPINGVGNERNIPPPTSMDEELPRYRAENVPPMTNGNSISRSIRLHQTHVSDDQSVQNGRDADEFLRESSPGFDVLVDDEVGDDDYYQREDQYGRTTEHEGGNLNSLREYDIGHSADYGSMADVDQEMHDSHGYDLYDRGQGQYNWEQCRASSERMSAGPVHVERRGYLKAEGPDCFEEPDLRHRLLKQRRVNGLRSVISHDYIPDNHVERVNYGASRRDSHHLSSHERDSRHLTSHKRDSRHLPPYESSLSSRLKGRIKLSGRSYPVDGIDFHPERDMDRGRNWGRLSPGRPQNSLHQGRLRDRIKGRVQEDSNNSERNFRGQQIRREVMDDRETNFAGPKRLAELKVGKNAENKEQQALGQRRNPMTEDHQQSEGDLSFEGPKPLSVILKRKRGAGAEASRSGILSSVNREEDNQREIKESLISSSKTTTLIEMHIGLPSASEEGKSNKEKSNFSMGKTVETKGETEASHRQFSQVHNTNELETEDGMIGDEALEDPEVEGVDRKEGDYGYEQVDEGDYNFDEGENADPEEEYLEDEDGDDDFAKKIGVMFS